MTKLINIKNEVATIDEINRENLKTLDVRINTLKTSRKEFVRLGLYTTEERNKTDLTDSEFFEEIGYLKKKRAMIVKLIKNKNNS